MKKFLLTAALASACLSAHAAGSFMNALALVTWLQSGELSMQAVGYIMGVADSEDGKTFCLPSGTTHVGLAQTVLFSVPKGTTGPHESLYQPANVFVREVLTKAYPCEPLQKPAQQPKKQ